MVLLKIHLEATEEPDGDKPAHHTKSATEFIKTSHQKTKVSNLLVKSEMGSWAMVREEGKSLWVGQGKPVPVVLSES